MMLGDSHILARTVLGCALALTASAAFAQVPLKAARTIPVPGGPGGFDWMLVDQAQHRLYASHGGTKTLTVLDLRTEMVRQIAAGDIAGIAVDAADGKVFTGGGDQKIVVLDNKTLPSVRFGQVTVTPQEAASKNSRP